MSSFRRHFQIFTILLLTGGAFGFSGVAARAETVFTRDPILRLETGQHTAIVRRISVSRQQRFLVSGSDDKTVRVYEIETGRLLNTLRIPVGEGNLGKVYSVAISPDGDTIAVGGWTGYNSTGGHNIYILNQRTGEMIRRIGGLPSVINHLSYSHNGSTLAASLGGANGIRIYGTENYREVANDADYEDDSYWADFDKRNRLVTTSWDGHIRLYNADFKRIKKIRAPGGELPFSAVFSPDGRRIAVGYDDSTTRVDVLSAEDLRLLFSANTEGIDNGGLVFVAWSAEGKTLYAGGRYLVDGRFSLLRWEMGGRGARQTFKIGKDTIMGIIPLADGRLAMGASDPLVSVLGKDGEVLWKHQGGTIDFRGQHGQNGIRLSRRGKTIRFGFKLWGKEPVSFSLKESALTLDPLEDQDLRRPITEKVEGLKVIDWEDHYTPKLNGVALMLEQYERSQSLAISPDGSAFLLGADWNLRSFDRKGKELWKVAAPGVAWAVNISGDGRLAVAGFGDGTLRWYRMTDGKEVLALFVQPDTKRWVLWTPKGYYRASAGGEDLIGWHLNNGADKSPDFFGASRFRNQFNRPDVIAQVLKTLDVKEAVRLADKVRGQKSVARDIREIQPPVISIIGPAPGEKQEGTKLVMAYRTQSKKGIITAIEAKVDGRPANVLKHNQDYFDERQSVFGQITLEIPPQNATINLIAKNKHGASEAARYYVNWEGTPDFYKPKLYVLAIGVTEYENKIFNTLDYPAKDAQDFVNALKTQKGALYKDIAFRVLADKKATKDAILDGLDWLEHETTSRDVVMVFLAGHGKRNPKDGGYQFLPHDANPGRLNRTSIDTSDLKKFLGAVSGKVVLFMDTCHSGELMAGARGDTLQDTARITNELAEAETGVIVFASSKGTQLSIERKRWENGAFTEALVEGITSRKADFTKDFFVSIAELEVFVSDTVKKLTQGAQTPVTTKPTSVEDFKVIRVSKRD